MSVSLSDNNPTRASGGQTSSMAPPSPEAFGWYMGKKKVAKTNLLPSYVVPAVTCMTSAPLLPRSIYHRAWKPWGLGKVSPAEQLLSATMSHCEKEWESWVYSCHLHYSTQNWKPQPGSKADLRPGARASPPSLGTWASTCFPPICLFTDLTGIIFKQVYILSTTEFWHLWYL